LTGLIYDAVAGASHSATFLEAFARAMDAPRCALLICLDDGDDWDVVRCHGWPDRDIRLYLDRYVAGGPLRSATLQAPEGTAAGDDEIYPRHEFELSVAFREFCKPRDASHGIASTAWGVLPF
jgi:hypothetical protein